MTDMVIPPEAVRDAEKAWRRAYHAKPFTGDDHSWMRAALEAALPHLRPMLELAGNLGRQLGRREALKEVADEMSEALDWRWGDDPRESYVTVQLDRDTYRQLLAAREIATKEPK